MLITTAVTAWGRRGESSPSQQYVVGLLFSGGLSVGRKGAARVPEINMLLKSKFENLR